MALTTQERAVVHAYAHDTYGVCVDSGRHPRARRWLRRLMAAITTDRSA